MPFGNDKGMPSRNGEAVIKCQETVRLPSDPLRQNVAKPAWNSFEMHNYTRTARSSNRLLKTLRRASANNLNILFFFSNTLRDNLQR
jgi:hypothetical protein